MTYRPGPQHPAKCGQALHLRSNNWSAITSAGMSGRLSSLSRRLVNFRQVLTWAREAVWQSWATVIALAGTGHVAIAVPPGPPGNYNWRASSCQAWLTNICESRQSVAVHRPTPDPDALSGRRDRAAAFQRYWRSGATLLCGVAL